MLGDARDVPAAKLGTKRGALSGSAGMGLAEDLGIPFVQEVYATRTATKR